MTKRILFLLSLLLLFSCSNKVEFPHLEVNTYGNIIGAWADINSNTSEIRYILITDKNVFLEFWPEESTLEWKDLKSVEVPNLIEVEKNTFTFKIIWDSDWQSDFDSLTDDEKENYESLEDFRMKNSGYYKIDSNGDLVYGAFLTFENAPDKLTKYLKTKY